MKKTLALLIAALLLVSVTACGNTTTDPQDTTANTGLNLPQDTGEASTTEVVTDAEGNIIPGPQETQAPDNITEVNPTFTECNLTLYVWVENSANVRSSTSLKADNVLGTVKGGDTLTATGESENWYRVKFTPKDGKEVDAYIAKTVAGDKAILDTFEDVESHEIEISHNVNVRTFPNAAGGDYNYVATLEKGSKVTRVAVGDGWSRILYEVTSESETDADGKPVKEMKEYYIINECIVGEETTEAATEASTEEVKA